MKTVTLTNLVSNALFASGTGWTSYTGVSGGEMWDAGASWNGFGSTVAIADVSGRKYYYAVSAKASDASRDTRYGLGLGSGGASVFSAPDIKVSSYTRKSSIRTSAATQNIYVGFYVPDATTTTVYCNGVLYIDLTSAFGAGNEPDLAWCDMFIPFFNGTTTVNLYTENSLIIEGGGHRNSRFVTDDGGYAIVGQNGSGGIVTYDGNYVIHTFTSSGTFICPGSGTAEVLVVAGGGGGGNDSWGGGGGGAGGFVYNSAFTIIAGTFPVTVGSGGIGSNTSQISTNGGNSVFSTLTAIGGGRGGGNSASGSRNGGSGGSGGGAGSGGNIGGGTAGQGYNGGDDIGSTGGGGGGGAGAVGSNAPGQDAGGNGGVGISTYSSLCALAGIGQNISGTYWICGGGGAGGWGAAGSGGAGGGGGGNATSGTANTGGGGGGQRANIGTGGSGGSGVVIIRYLVNSLQL